MEKYEIGGTAYEAHVVDKFLEVSGLYGDTFDEDKPEWFKELMKVHLNTFADGYYYGHELASVDIPDCDQCDVHSKAAERGPPESHPSMQDR